MSWLIYFVSILDGVNGAGSFVAGTGFVVVLLSGLWLMMATHMEDESLVKLLKPAFRWSLIVSASGALVATVVPPTNAIIRAYVMVEGSKVINAPNAEKATAELLKRVDALIGKIGKGDD